MRTMIICKTTDRGIHSFYLVENKEWYLLFSQGYKRGVHNYFSKGVSLNRAMDFSRAHHDRALSKTMTKLPLYIKYIEKEYGIAVLNQTKRKAQEHCLFGACA